MHTEIFYLLCHLWSKDWKDKVILDQKTTQELMNPDNGGKNQASLDRELNAETMKDVKLRFRALVAVEEVGALAVASEGAASAVGKPGNPRPLPLRPLVAMAGAASSPLRLTRHRYAPKPLCSLQLKQQIHSKVDHSYYLLVRSLNRRRNGSDAGILNLLTWDWASSASQGSFAIRLPKGTLMMSSLGGTLLS
uniref:Uncharacterized protein n=1 Tax=Oryza punctata TaxID=4537 RepID=A0A0E0JT45_ORYPU